MGNVSPKLICWKVGPQCNVQRWGFWKWLDHEDWDLINGFVHWGIHSWTDYWEVVENGKLGLTGGSELLAGCAFEGYISSLACSSLSHSASWSPWDQQHNSAMPFWHRALPHHRPWNMEPSDHGLKLLKPWAKINNFSLSYFSFFRYFVPVTKTLLTQYYTF
jgi:hypothetical protein